MLSQKQMLVDTMRKLIKTISNNKQQQSKIFDSLCKDDINKILQNLEHQDIIIRKLSAKFISQLLYDNNNLKQKFCETLQISLINGNIMINKIPDQLKRSPQRLLDVLKLLKNTSSSSNKSNLFWYINPSQSVISVQYMDLHSFLIGQFIDPKQVMFGITYFQTQKQRIISPLPIKQTDYSLNDSKYYVRTNLSQKSKLNFTNRQRATVTLQNAEHQQVQKSNELSFRTDRSSGGIQKNNKLGFNLPERGGIVTDRHLQVTSPFLSYSNHKTRQGQSGKDSKYKFGLQLTSPSSAASHTLKPRQQKSSQKHIIYLGGSKPQSRQYSNNFNNTMTSSTQSKPYVFNYIRSPNSTSYTQRDTDTSRDYSKLIFDLKQNRELSEIKAYRTYKPSQNLIRKIKARD